MNASSFADVDTFGEPDVLMVIELPIPEPGAGEMRIKVAAATVNPVDALVRKGLAFLSDASTPYVPGMEVAGVVDQIDEG